MAKLPIRPPRINVSSLKGSFWKQLGMIILATTISLFFTILTTNCWKNAIAPRIAASRP